jgi:hypothetical protein
VEVTALFPILALIFTKKLRPTIMVRFHDVVWNDGSASGDFFLQTQGDVVFRSISTKTISWVLALHGFGLFL